MTADALLQNSTQLDPSDPYARQAQTFPTFAEEQIERASAYGTTEDLAKGTVVFERGQRALCSYLAD